MPNNFRRPNLPYINISLPNDKRYQLLTRSNRRPPTDQMVDSDINYIIDGLNTLDIQMEGIALGDIPGIDDPNNNNKLLAAPGNWVFVQASNILDQSITGGKLFPQTITAVQLADGGIPASKIAPNAVTTIKILDANVTLAKMANDSVGTDQIIDANVTLAKMANDSVDTDNLVDDCVTTAKILDVNVTTAKIANDAVTTLKILNANVTEDKIADGAVTLAKMSADVIKVAASKADQIAGISNNVYTSPLVQQNHPSALKFTCSFTPSTGDLIEGYNVASVVRNSIGNYTINFIVPFANTDYGISPTPFYVTNNFNIPFIISKSVGSVNFGTRSAGGALQDPVGMTVCGYGTQ